MNRKKMVDRIEAYDFYVVNAPGWTDEDLKDTLAQLKKEAKIKKGV